MKKICKSYWPLRKINIYSSIGNMNNLETYSVIKLEYLIKELTDFRCKPSVKIFRYTKTQLPIFKKNQFEIYF